MNITLMDNLTFLQDVLNEYITKDWKNKRSELDFMIASHMEMSELIDTEYKDENGVKHNTSWKWWKNQDSSIETAKKVNWNDLHPAVLANIKIELTDLVFFTLSQKILNDHTDPDVFVPSSDNDWLNFMSITANNLLQRPGAAMSLILGLAEKLNFNVGAYYIAKHTLNFIRQLSGYTDGSYKIIVDGKEDNELLHDVINGITIEDLEKDFDGVANKIMNDVYDIFSVDTESRKNMDLWRDFKKSCK